MGHPPAGQLTNLSQTGLSPSGGGNVQNWGSTSNQNDEAKEGVQLQLWDVGVIPIFMTNPTPGTFKF